MVLCVSFILLVALSDNKGNAKTPHETQPIEESESLQHEEDIQDLINAIIEVESGGNPRAIGDSGQAVGILQIWPITVKDANRILGDRIFSLEDRFDPYKSIDIFLTITEHYSRNESFEVIARRWNGGPTGEKKAATKKYWEKVKSALLK